MKLNKTQKIKKVKKATPKPFKDGYFLVKWGNGTISVLYAGDEVDLFIGLDSEGDPSCARIYILPEYFHITTDVKSGKILAYDQEANLKRFRFSNDIFSRVYSY